MVEGAYDILIVSDLHLRGGWASTTRGLYHFDEEFADFLRYYRLHGEPGRRWRLVVGGDFIEFLYITDLPDSATPLLRGATFTESERRYGAGSDAVKARWKLDLILRSSHPQLLLALARFVAEGNEVVVLRGNHDAEMVWPEVKEHFRRLLAEHHPSDVSYLAMKEAVAARVRFPEWFWLEPGLLYVEHGCQYDPFCSFDTFLHPVLPSRPTTIERSIAELAIRYFTNPMRMMNALAAENIKSVSEYVAWVVGKNPRALPQTLRLYAGMVHRILEKSGAPDPVAAAAVRVEHERRVAAVDESLGLLPGTAAALDALHAPPIMRSTPAVVRFLALDLLTVAGILLATLALIPLLCPGTLAVAGAVLALAAIGLLVYAGSIRYLHVTDAVQLAEKAGRIAQLFGVPYVVLGHSHKAGETTLTSGARYLNVGTWVPEGERAYFVFCAVIGQRGQRRPRLWRWNKERAAPEPFGEL